MSNIEKHLKKIYPSFNTEYIVEKIAQLFPINREKEFSKQIKYWDESDVILITYPDSIKQESEKPLNTLKTFLDTYLKSVISKIHILPFFPFSSDDGFAVKDYESVRSDLGNWKDINEIAKTYTIMSDVVINHSSASHVWFEQFCNGQQPGSNYFKTAIHSQELCKVVRPRPSNLLRPTMTPSGTRNVWCTFGHDQVDFDFSNPDVLIEFLRLFRKYINEGIKIFRLDAVGYIWKEIGTTCINHPNTHEIIKLIRKITDSVDDNILLVTETNVPSHENLEYFGNSNEAHIIYNFSLPPLLLHALITGNSTWLRRWMMSLPPSNQSSTFLNFTASHDGIGLRPAEGILPEREIQLLIKTVASFGGLVTNRVFGNNEVPYEINSTYLDALKGTTMGLDCHHMKRYLASQMIMISLAGIPAFYINSLLASPNDFDSVVKTGNNRAINREKLNFDEITKTLYNDDNIQTKIYRSILRALEIRNKQPAFHPNATQFTLQLDKELFGFWRQSIDQAQAIFSITNLTSQRKDLNLSDLNLFTTTSWIDLLSEKKVDRETIFNLEPYQTLWITNRH